jgi:hypothetical protein
VRGLAVVAVITVLLFGAGSASAAGLSPDSFGVNSATGPTDFSLASASGLGVLRDQVIQGTNADALVALAAASHLRLAPMLGLPQTLAPSAAATAMAQYVTAFAQRYGPNGSFWSQNPQLPYLPVEDFEIGNEPNIPLIWVADATHLHWSDPSAYAQVYEAARWALHQVDPSGVAVVGGLADSGNLGVDLQHDEEWLAALTPGTVDAVGFHPYTFPVSFAEMNSDTEELRQWMDANGMQNAPIVINEVGACDVTPQSTLSLGNCAVSISSSAWGTFAANFAEWSLCSRALNVTSFQPEYWGDLSNTDVNAILALVSTEGTLTPYGDAYLAEVQSLEGSGCPLSNTSPPTISGSPAVGQSLHASSGGWAGASAQTVAYQWERCDTTGHCAYVPGATSSGYVVQAADVGSRLVAAVTAGAGSGTVVAWSTATGLVTQPAPPPTGGGAPPAAHTSSVSMLLQISGTHVRGHTLTVTVRAIPASGGVVVIATKKGHRVRLRLTHRKGSQLTFSARLAAGHWTLTATCPPPAGYLASAPMRRTVAVR